MFHFESLSNIRRKRRSISLQFRFLVIFQKLFLFGLLLYHSIINQAKYSLIIFPQNVFPNILLQLSISYWVSSLNVINSFIHFRLSPIVVWDVFYFSVDLFESFTNIIYFYFELVFHNRKDFSRESEKVCSGDYITLERSVSYCSIVQGLLVQNWLFSNPRTWLKSSNMWSLSCSRNIPWIGDPEFLILWIIFILITVFINSIWVLLTH